MRKDFDNGDDVIAEAEPDIEISVSACALRNIQFVRDVLAAGDVGFLEAVKARGSELFSRGIQKVTYPKCKAFSGEISQNSKKKKKKKKKGNKKGNGKGKSGAFEPNSRVNPFKRYSNRVPFHVLTIGEYGGEELFDPRVTCDGNGALVLEDDETPMFQYLRDLFLNKNINGTPVS